jgi:hypothetical protein
MPSRKRLSIIVTRGSFAVSTFFLLPPRPVLGQHFARYLGGFLPGLHWNEADRAALAEALGATAARQADVFVVFREDLPEGMELRQALVGDFGAEAGDEVVDVVPSGVKRWHITSE